MRRISLMVGIFLFSFPAYSWGEMGHDIVARVAVRLVEERAPLAMAKPFLMKEHMLGHLANVPDIVWRSGDKKTTTFNGPTHYVDFEYLQADTSKIDPARLPRDLATFVAMIHSNCKASKKDCAPGKTDEQKIAKTGTAPLRVGQFAELMRKSLADTKGLSQKKGKKKEDSPFDQRVNSALLYAGLMAHFVGDLANPMHTSKDYDGWDSGAGGLHEFFESDLVNAADFSLIQDVFIEARDKRPFEQAEKKYVPKAEERKDPITGAWVIVADSQSRLKELFDLDRKASRLEESKAEGRVRAKRKESKAVHKEFRAFITERLAMGADALATVWIRQWEAAGKPDLTPYFSFDYPVKPDFIVPVEGMGKN